MPRFSFSQLLRFKIRELCQVQGLKVDPEVFYEMSMKAFIAQIDQKIFEIQHPDMVDPTLQRIKDVFGAESIEDNPLPPQQNG
jgi:hypothetical protein